MVAERVTIWRPADESRILLMAGQTTGYAMDPVGEYVFGVIGGSNPMRSRRGRERRLIRPGQLLAWDPSNAHAGTAVDANSWSARLMIIEAADLARLGSDSETDVLADVAFPEPAMADPELVRGFARLFRAFEAPLSRLELDEQLAEWLDALIERSSAVRRPRASLGARDERALRLARDYLGDHPGRNVGLDELAAAAGIGKFRLVRLFRERTGLPPHALQVAHRIRAARRMLEAGETIGETAHATGFFDQSHLNRHFRRSLGVTPGEYQRRLRPAYTAPPRPPT
jgi:AraC-like DNA-binding protein